MLYLEYNLQTVDANTWFVIYWKILRRRLICLASLKMIHTFYIFHVCFYAIISSVILCRVINSRLILLKAKWMNRKVYLILRKVKWGELIKVFIFRLSSCESGQSYDSGYSGRDSTASNMTLNPDLQAAIPSIMQLLDQLHSGQQQLLQLWQIKKAKLDQCLQLRMFEQDCEKVTLR